MDDFDFNPTVIFAVWPNAFTPAELDKIEAYGDRLAADEATVAANRAHDVVQDKVRVTRTAWLFPRPKADGYMTACKRWSKPSTTVSTDSI